MGQFRTPDIAETAYLTALTASDMELRLFTNQVELGLTTGQIAALTVGDFTEAAFAGYSAATLTGGTWTITGGSPSTASYGAQTYQSTANQTAVAIWGYYLTQSGELRGFRQLDAPITIEFNQEQLLITPILELSDSQGDTMPTGSISDYAGGTTPDGWLLCDGSAVSRVTYSELFNIVGTTYGPGDGTSTFDLPDCRGRFNIGKSISGTGATLGETGGSLDHTHDLTAGYAKLGTGASQIDYDTVPASFVTDTRVTGVSASATAGNAADGVQLAGNTGTANPAYLSVNKIIKT